jgi:NOL1/NOP2/sun family putative RNA methylase
MEVVGYNYLKWGCYMKLPVIFLEKMKMLLDSKAYDEFLKSFDFSRYYGLRVNTLKIGVDEFKKLSPFRLEPIPWAEDGFYYFDGDKPGKHPHYHAGLYYIQEPSAMLPGAVIDARPGENVLDLCAAPGGKTVQMAAGMQGEGLLVVNDINAGRLKAVMKNIELYGITNAIVTNESPERLALKFEGFFDKILVDAPCSGEGMFRKDEDAIKSWDKYQCDLCCGMQRNILDSVDRMLKPGGNILYSTCTFSPEENEKMISYFLDKFKQYELVEIKRIAGIESGRPDWSDNNPELLKTARLWPHKVKGEGHFAALLKKNGQVADKLVSTKQIHGTGMDKTIEPFYNFVKENLNRDIKGQLFVKGKNLYSLPIGFPELSGIKLFKFGWFLGEIKDKRFEPSHSLIMSLKKEDIKNTIDFGSGSLEIIRYLKGETLMIEGRKGYVGVLVDGCTAGWAKQTGDMLKNLYPKGWRMMN